MKPENPDDALLEQGLAAWDVPEPAPSLIERILSQNAKTLTALSTPPSPTATELPALQPAPLQPAPLQEDTPAMLPTDLRTERSMRPFWTATLLGFAAAAAIVLAFMAGRQSNPPAPVAPVVPSVEIQVSAPAPVAVPPAPPVPPTPPAVPQEITAPQNTEAVPAPPPTPPTPRVRRGRRSEGISPDLKNPFRGISGSDDVESPFAKGTESGRLENPFGSQTQGSQDADGSAITSPFGPKTATLRVGTHPGSPPADITIDGKSVGRTPLAAVKVSPGEHTVVFRWPNKRQSVTVKVEANKSKIVRAGNE